MGGSTFIEDESLTVDGAGIGWREDQNQNVIVDNGVITACDGGRVLPASSTSSASTPPASQRPISR